MPIGQDLLNEWGGQYAHSAGPWPQGSGLVLVDFDVRTLVGFQKIQSLEHAYMLHAPNQPYANTLQRLELLHRQGRIEGGGLAVPGVDQPFPVSTDLHQSIDHLNAHAPAWMDDMFVRVFPPATWSILDLCAAQHPLLHPLPSQNDVHAFEEALLYALQHNWLDDHHDWQWQWLHWSPDNTPSQAYYGALDRAVSRHQNQVLHDELDGSNPLFRRPARKL